MRWIFLFFLIIPFAAHAVCDPGYYLSDGNCQKCVSGYYCTNDIKYKCPENQLNQYDIPDAISVTVKGPYSWGSQSTTSNCVGHTFVTTPTGLYLAECHWNGKDYYNPCSEAFLWYQATIGYYLSGYISTSFHAWYYGVKPCTNAPAHAHYTGAGTPDATDGSIIDANDCPWECDYGYGNHGDECVPLCSAGVQHIKTGTGLKFNLYHIAYSSPALHVKYNNTVCYSILSPGTAQNTINIDVSGTVYHVEN